MYIPQCLEQQEYQSEKRDLPFLPASKGVRLAMCPIMTVSRPSKVYVLGDQTFDYEDSLAQLLRSDNVLLAWFFRKAFFALNTELGRLPLDARDATPKFSSIADLLKRKRDGCISPTLELVLCLVHAFAAFIWSVIVFHTLQAALTRGPMGQATF